MTTDTAHTPDNYDTPWKEAIEHHFPEFMAFYFSVAHSQIDWQKGYIFLDQELQAVVQDAELGKRFVDKLVQVNRLSGQEDWIYIHLEVQGSAQAEFAERMFVYNYRLPDAYRHSLLFSGIGLALVGAAAAANSGLPALPQRHNQAFTMPNGFRADQEV